MQNQVVILAGGFGTRLRERIGLAPKPMAILAGHHLLEHQINLCRAYGFKNILLLVHYEHSVISGYFGNGEKFGVNLTYQIEDAPLGTGGAIVKALPLMGEVFLVLYGDTYLDIDLRNIWNAHISSNVDVTLFLHPNDHPQDSDLIKVDNQSMVQSIHAFGDHKKQLVRNLVNAGLYVCSKNSFDSVELPSGKFDIVKDVFALMIDNGLKLKGYISPEYIKDMGTPARLDKVLADIEGGVPEKLAERNARQAIFLDRDGTINKEVDHLRFGEQIEVITGAAEGIRRLNRSGILAICVTNQPVLARGEISMEGLESVSAHLDYELGLKGAYLDRTYICPHHPDSGYPGENVSLKIVCGCRKPKTGLIDQACSDLNIDRRSSWMIGDTTSDILAGIRAGLKTILVRTGYGGGDSKYLVAPDYVMPDLSSAIDWILVGHRSIGRQCISVVNDGLNERCILVGGAARAGKSSSAKVLKELFEATGRVVHLIGLDGWLRPKDKRVEGAGVLSRYDISKVIPLLTDVIGSGARVNFPRLIYERKSKEIIQGGFHSIGPKDLIIVEGVPALLIEELRSLSKVRVYIDVDEVNRIDRLTIDYSWRGKTDQQISDILTSRASDELKLVKYSTVFATHILKT